MKPETNESDLTDRRVDPSLSDGSESVEFNPRRIEVTSFDLYEAYEVVMSATATGKHPIEAFSEYIDGVRAQRGQNYEPGPFERLIEGRE